MGLSFRREMWREGSGWKCKLWSEVSVVVLGALFAGGEEKKNFSQPHLNSFNHNDAKKIHANYEQEHYLLIC